MKQLDITNKSNMIILSDEASADIRTEVEKMEVMEMTEKEQIAILIDQFTDLQRIKVAENREKEIDYQIRTTKAKLEAMGIVTEDLRIDQ